MRSSQASAQQFQVSSRYENYEWVLISPTQRSLLSRMAASIIVTLQGTKPGYNIFVTLHVFMSTIYMMMRAFVACLQTNVVIDGKMEIFLKVANFFSHGMISTENSEARTAIITLYSGIILTLVVALALFAAQFKPARFFLPQSDTRVFIILVVANLMMSQITTMVVVTLHGLITEGRLYDFYMSVFALCLCWTAQFTGHVVSTCGPSFCTAPGAPFVIEKTELMSTFSLVFLLEAVPLITKNATVMKFVMLFLVIGNVRCAIEYSQKINWVSKHAAAIISAMGCTASVMHMISLLSYSLQIKATTLLYVMVGCFALFYLFFLDFLTRKLAHIRNIVHEALRTNDFSIMPDDDVTYTLYCCHSLDIIQDDMKIWEEGMKRFSNSFAFVSSYMKVLTYFGNSAATMKPVITKLIDGSTEDISRSVLVTLLQLRYFDAMDADLSPLIASATDSCLSILHAFWTEVLHNQTDRLASLARSANAKFIEATALLVNMKYMKRMNLESDKSYQKIISFMGSKRARESVDGLHERIQSLTPQCDHLFGKRRVTCKKTRFDVKRLVSKPDRRTKKSRFYQRMSVIGPWLFGVVSSVFLSMFLLEVHRERWIFDDVFRLVSREAANIVSLKFLSTVNLTEQDLKYVSPDWIREMGIHEPENTFIKRKTSSVQELERVWRKFTITKDACIIQGRNHNDIPEFDQNQKLAMTMHILENMSFVESRESGHIEDVIEVLETYLKWFTGTVIPYVVDERTTTLHTKLVYMVIGGLVTILLSLICHFMAMLIQDQFFDPFLRIPKTAVTELTDKIGDRLAIPLEIMESVSPEVRFNLKILSYQSNTYSFPTRRDRHVKACTTIVLSVVIIVASLLVTSNLGFLSITKCLRNSVRAMDFMRMPVLMLKLGYRTIDFTDNPTVEKIELLDKDRQQIENVTMNMLVNGWHNNKLVGKEIMKRLCDVGDECSSFAELVMFYSSIQHEMHNMLNQSLENPTLVEKKLQARNYIIRLVEFCMPKFHNNYDRANIPHKLNHSLVLQICFVVYLLVLAIRHMHVENHLAELRVVDDSTLAARCSIPQSVIFTPTSKAMTSADHKQNVSYGMTTLNSQLVFDKLDQYILFIDNKQSVVGATPAALELFGVDTISEPFPKCVEILCNEELHIGSEPRQRFMLEVRKNSETMTIEMEVLQLDGFHFSNKDVVTACILKDISQNTLITRELSSESNKLNILMTQIMPLPVAKALLGHESLRDSAREMVPFASVSLSSKTPIEARILREIQSCVRSGLIAHDYITFMGRSCQSFRIAAGVFTSETPLAELVKGIIHFCQTFIADVRNQSEFIDVVCGIHVSGPFKMIIGAEETPVFDLDIPETHVPLMLMGRCPPNTVTVTKQVYDQAIDGEFQFSFTGEILYQGQRVCMYRVV